MYAWWSHDPMLVKTFPFCKLGGCWYLFVVQIFLSFASFCPLHLFVLHIFLLVASLFFLFKRHNFISFTSNHPLIPPVICMVIWCFPIWISSFIKLSYGDLQYEYIWTFCSNPFKKLHDSKFKSSSETTLYFWWNQCHQFPKWHFLTLREHCSPKKIDSPSE